MANPSAQKRDKERQRQEYQKEKVAKRQARRAEKSARVAGSGDVDPDVAWIVPGPQPTE